VADRDVSYKPLEVIRGENISDEPVSLLRVEMSVIGDDSGRILTPVLDGQEPLINVFEDVVVSQNSDDAAHKLNPVLYTILAQLLRVDNYHSHFRTINKPS
jgi:hypothetical protein